MADHFENNEANFEYDDTRTDPYGFPAYDEHAEVLPEPVDHAAIIADIEDGLPFTRDDVAATHFGREVLVVYDFIGDLYSKEPIDDWEAKPEYQRPNSTDLSPAEIRALWFQAGTIGTVGAMVVTSFLPGHNVQDTAPENSASQPAVVQEGESEAPADAIAVIPSDESTEANDDQAQHPPEAGLVEVVLTRDDGFSNEYTNKDHEPGLGVIAVVSENRWSGETQGSVIDHDHDERVSFGEVLEPGEVLVVDVNGDAAGCEVKITEPENADDGYDVRMGLACDNPGVFGN